MKRTLTVRLPADLSSQLELEAARLGISRAEFIRQTIREKIDASAAPRQSHPFASIIGILEDGEPDLAARVDKILCR